MVMLPHPQATSRIMVGLEHPTLRLRGGDLTTSSKSQFRFDLGCLVFAWSRPFTFCSEKLLSCFASPSILFCLYDCNFLVDQFS